MKARIIYHKIFFFLVLMGLLSACISSQKQRIFKKSAHASAQRSFRPLNAEDRSRLSKLAQTYVGKTELSFGKHKFRPDCSGTVRAIFAHAHVFLGGVIKDKNDNDVKAIYRYVKKYGKIIFTKPKAGDLVFFHNTYDRSRNGQMNDALTHIGIVEKVKGNVVFFVHHLGQSIIRSRMDLSQPDKTMDLSGNIRLNHILRRAQGSFRAYTAAELFAGFGRL
jgi:probable lipoprotein NlpC